MTLSNATILYIVELAIYLILLPIVLHLGYRHGIHGILGYFYLNLACTIRIVSDIISIIEKDDTTSIAAVVVSSVGLSPLLLSLAGFLHEIHVKLLSTTTATETQRKKTIRWMWFAQIQIHAVAIIGIALIIIGAVKIISANTTKDMVLYTHLREAGVVLLALLLVNLLLYSIWMLHWSHQAHAKTVDEGVSGSSIWTFIAAIFVGAKIMYAVAYTFDHGDPEINPISGKFVYKVVLVVGAQLLAAVSMAIGGWISAGSRSRCGSRDESVLSYEGEHKPVKCQR